MEGVEAAPARAEAELMAKEDMVCKPVLEEECGLEAAEEVLPGAGGAAAEPAGRVPLSPVGSNFLLATESPPPLSLDELAQKGMAAPEGGENTMPKGTLDPVESSLLHDDEADAAIRVLLSLQQDRSPLPERAERSGNSSSPTPSTESETRYEPAGERWSPRDRIIRKDYSKLGRDDFQRATASTARFYCKFPRCGKAYSSTDAVRKHCRQRHLEWLRRLGHGCPALYCEWDEE